MATLLVTLIALLPKHSNLYLIKFMLYVLHTKIFVYKNFKTLCLTLVSKFLKSLSLFNSLISSLPYHNIPFLNSKNLKVNLSLPMNLMPNISSPSLNTNKCDILKKRLSTTMRPIILPKDL